MLFISWSKPRSQKLAEALREFIDGVLWASNPWLSASDVKLSSNWSSDVLEGVKKAQYGIICLTPENWTEPWLNFEAGGLLISGTKKCTVILLLGPDGFAPEGPLSCFQYCRADKEGVWKLVNHINENLPRSVPLQSLKILFDQYWPKLERTIAALRPIAERDRAAASTIQESPAELRHGSTSRQESATVTNQGNKKESLDARRETFFEFLRDHQRKDFSYVPNPLALKICRNPLQSGESPKPSKQAA